MLGFSDFWLNVLRKISGVFYTMAYIRFTLYTKIQYTWYKHHENNTPRWHINNPLQTYGCALLDECNVVYIWLGDSQSFASDTLLKFGYSFAVKLSERQSEEHRHVVAQVLPV